MPEAAGFVVIQVVIQVAIQIDDRRDRWWVDEGVALHDRDGDDRERGEANAGAE